MDLTLREICEKYEVTRRAVQGYEKHRLVAPTGKNERGYLLYDTEAQRKIEQIRKYQRFGFMLREIPTLLEGTPEERKRKLSKRLEALEGRTEELSSTIREIRGLISELQD